MPFPKEGAEKSAKSQAANKPENWAGRTYSAKEEKEFGRLGERMESFHGEKLLDVAEPAGGRWRQEWREGGRGKGTKQEKEGP